MPELAEVAYYRARWDPGLGAKVTRVHLNPGSRIFRGIVDPELEVGTLAGRIFLTSETHGKNLLFGFEGGSWLGGHLGMTGRLWLAEDGYEPAKHDHLVIFQNGRALVFSDPRMFGRIRFEKGKNRPDWWGSLPAEVLSPKFAKATVRAALERRARSPVKALLLDQDHFPGIGNWMADEILWRIGIHPATLAGDLSGQANALWNAVRKVSREAMKVIAPDWSKPPDGWLFNHRWKDGGTCPRCHADLTRESLRGRTTCWCPFCQKEAGASSI